MKWNTVPTLKTSRLEAPVPGPGRPLADIEAAALSRWEGEGGLIVSGVSPPGRLPDLWWHPGWRPSQPAIE